MPHLISITPSHYCEKSRWSLELAGIEFKESRYTPFFHVRPVKKAGGVRATPVLQTPEGTLSDSVAISTWIQAQNKDFLPYGGDEEQGKKFLEWENYFGNKIGPHTRLVAYHHILPNKDFVMHCMQDPVTGTPAHSWFSGMFPIFRFLMKKAMNITPKAAEQSLQKLRERFDEIEEKAEGQFIIGDSLTIADISFASLTAPMVAPEKYGANLPELDSLNPELRELVEEFRAHPAGKRCLWLYENYR